MRQMSENMPPKKTFLQLRFLITLFFFSGFSALCYQIVWQRLLFAAFGINIESVTIIVSLFMFGLGIGSLVGGWLQKHPRYLLCLFVGCELLIGVFGLGSHQLIEWVGSLSNSTNLWSVAIRTYSVFGVPTLLMGATLPILVNYINLTIGHTGKSISLLYASNTLGAATAAFLIVKLLFVFFGLQSVILIAVGLNILTAFFAWAVYGNIDKTNPSIVQPVAIKADQGIETINRSLSRNLLLFIGFALGYLSLSQELIWYRILGFISANNPEMLAMILTAFLVGIALAAIKTNQLLSTHINTNKYILSSLLLMIFVWYFTFPLMAWAADESGKKASALLIGLIMTGVTAYITGGIFPILCHMLQQGTQNNAGSTVSKIYFANVMGATLGPLFTGFVLFEYFLFQTSVLIIGLLTAAMIVFLLYTNAALSKLYKKAIFTLTCLSTLIGLTLHFTAYNGFLEKLQESKKPFNSFNYNRSGYISVIDTSIFGNGAYDGKMSIDPLNDKSGIRRAYAIPAMHPNPKRILQIGLSGGSWAKALSMYQPLEQLVSVEINKGYLDIIGQYPDHADILHNQKIKLVIDDGRRWLKNNPDEKFDFIISNTIYHWRSNATNMLSIEFMNIAKRHLNPGGLVFIIDTDADEVSYTAAHVFSYVSRNFGNMVIAGDSEAVVSTEQKMSNLAKFITPDGQQLFQTPESAHIIADMTYPNQREAILNMKNLLVITDDNMATEFKMHKKPH